MDPNTNPHLHRLRERGCSCLFRHAAAITASEYNCKLAHATPSLLTHSLELLWRGRGAARTICMYQGCRRRCREHKGGLVDGAAATCTFSNVHKAPKRVAAGAALCLHLRRLLHLLLLAALAAAPSRRCCCSAVAATAGVAARQRTSKATA